MVEAPGLGPEVRRAVAWLGQRAGAAPRVAVVAGSGLSGLGDALRDARSFPYVDIPHMPCSSVPGHAGVLRVGNLGGVRTALLAGRRHFYEGAPECEVTFALRAMAAWGVRHLVLTCAAGCLEPMWRAGDLMLISEAMDWQHLGLWGRGGAVGCGANVVEGGAMHGLLRVAVPGAGILLREGVYVSVPGPNYETRAEIGLLRLSGAHAVGMSTSREWRIAREVGMDVAGVALLSNGCVETVRDAPLTHDEVLEAGRRAESGLVALLEGALRGMG